MEQQLSKWKKWSTWEVFNNMKSVLSSRNSSLNTRMRLTKCYVWSTLLYGAETWTITKTLTKRIDAFEMWTYR